jgi:hypothetical protein
VDACQPLEHGLKEILYGSKQRYYRTLYVMHANPIHPQDHPKSLHSIITQNFTNLISSEKQWNSMANQIKTLLSSFQLLQGETWFCS